MSKLLLSCMIALTVLMMGCQNEIVCNDPYIRLGESCCLDQNSNSICDSDESVDTGKSTKNQNEVEMVEIEPLEPFLKECLMYDNIWKDWTGIGSLCNNNEDCLRFVETNDDDFKHLENPHIKCEPTTWEPLVIEGKALLCANRNDCLAEFSIDIKDLQEPNTHWNEFAKTIRCREKACEMTAGNLKSLTSSMFCTLDSCTYCRGSNNCKTVKK